MMVAGFVIAMIGLMVMQNSLHTAPTTNFGMDLCCAGLYFMISGLKGQESK